MKTCWVISEDAEPGKVDPAALSTVTETWSNVDNWKLFQTNNVVSHSLKQSVQLIKRAFHAVVNLYVPGENFTALGRPMGVRLYSGEFNDNAISNKEDIILLNLVSPNNDIVLMYGFDLSPVDTSLDVLEQRFLKAYRHNVNTIIRNNPDVQYVLVDYDFELAPNLQDLDNLTIDSLDTVLELL